jgi:transcription initiation factor TFIIB
MSNQSGEEIDLILVELSAEMDAATEEDVKDQVTMGQAISDEQQISVTDEFIESLGKDLDAPEAARNLARSLCEQYRDVRGDLYGVALELAAAACLYCAVKVSEVPLSPTDFAEADDTVVTQKGLLRRSKEIASQVGLDPSAFFGSGQYVERYCQELDLSAQVSARASKIVLATEEAGLSSGKSPTGWAAAAVYNAGLDVGEKITQADIAEVADVTEVTIRNRYKEQREYIREKDVLLRNATDVVEHVSQASGSSELVRALAVELIELAQDAGFAVHSETTVWGLAALRRAGQLVESKMSLKGLSQYTEAESSKISKRAKKMRPLMRRRDVDRFRSEYSR